MLPLRYDDGAELSAGVALALALPWMLAKRLPETLWALGANFAICFVLLWSMSLGYFAWVFLNQEVDLGRRGAFWHLAGVALQSGLIWAPVIGVVLVQIPQRWRPDL